jgi:dipeptidyl aminopeptidase/acylaminoacyl peptidase
MSFASVRSRLGDVAGPAQFFLERVAGHPLGRLISLVRHASCCILLLLFGLGLACPAIASHPLTIDDVLDLTRVDRTAISPDGEWVAVVLQRPARAGEVYGRTSYEVDPARSDIWLISLRTDERRNLTDGRNAAAGYWCPAWSPDGSKLAMLSTRPEGAEPRGGDNVRLYVWDRATGALRRSSDSAMMTQTRYGSPLYQMDLRGGADRSVAAHQCSDEESAPFLWLDNRRLLAIALPPGRVSGLIDEYARPSRSVDATMRALREGVEPTISAVGSGAERTAQAEEESRADIRAIDVQSMASVTLATVPAYPFRGELTVSLAPDGRRAAILATTGAIPPAQGERIPQNFENWLVQKRLGFLDLARPLAVRWVAMPPQSAYPLELYDWSPDSRRVAFRGRRSFAGTTTSLLVASSSDLSVRQVGDRPVGGAATVSVSRDAPVFWADNGSLLVRSEAPGPAETGSATAPAAARTDWWRMRMSGAATNLTSTLPDVPTELRRSDDGRFFALAGNRLLAFDVASRGLEPRPLAASQAGAIVWPSDPRVASSHLAMATGSANGRTSYALVSLQQGQGATRSFTLPQDAQLVDISPDFRRALIMIRARDGQHLRALSLEDGQERGLISINTHLADVTWGETRLIDYRGGSGQELKAAIILPPAYREGERYPVIAWVYPGYNVRGLGSYFLDPYLPGIYNLQLYAARGYVVLIPSMPLPSNPAQTLPDLSVNVLPAIDRLVELGIADGNRVGVMGQSFGGFGTYALVTRTDRFRAAVAMSGDTDFGSFARQFDMTARGYDGIEHEKSYNWALEEIGQPGFGTTPETDPSLYLRNSPLTYVDRVHTPLLLIHGEYDKRAPMTQAEAFFFSLYRQGRTARLLRYWGESHSLSQSPANVRSIYREILSWFDRYLAPGTSAAAH